MGAGATFVVKKNDGSTDTTYNFISPFGGPTSPAIWAGGNLGDSLDHCPQMRMTGRDASAGKERVFRLTYVYPEVENPSTGVYTIANRFRWSSDIIVPIGMKTTDIYEAISQGANAMAKSEFKDVLKSLYPAS